MISCSIDAKLEQARRSLAWHQEEYQKGSENEWTPTLLAERQRRLVGVLKDHWNLAIATGTAAR